MNGSSNKTMEDANSNRKRSQEGQITKEDAGIDNDEKEYLVFEDPFGDEFEEEQVDEELDNDLDNEEEDDEEDEEVGMSEEVGKKIMQQKNKSLIEDNEQHAPKQVWRPGVDQIAEGEALEYDPSAYVMYHSLQTEWPCLSFDILKDNLGESRQRV